MTGAVDLLLGPRWYLRKLVYSRHSSRSKGHVRLARLGQDLYNMVIGLLSGLNIECW